ncbi:DUF4393 domain-containing protein [Vibrio vulnificus]|nr:DUF4393 domain-containing protein [Vibrio vulnificus]EIO2325339.1 DUF4393 domain-containing protein [Vibrio vulnificus]EIO4070154.1 DUF4393 domain-containing protein [Vibrio vulnificus]ELH0905566.1 DUF4393 domain-containing protein [Vibrio vulnificus]ELK8311661.1 DUF4393 domain-containing protein [Vibrio vulnificus]
MINEIVEAISGENGLLKEVYGDLAKPGVKQVGKALETVLGLGNTVLIPIQLLNAKGKYVVKSNLNKYREKLESSNTDDIVQVAPEVGVPILEKLTYVTNEELVNLYTELLAKASSKSNCGMAHPNFVNVINSLSPDEALLIGALKGKKSIPFVDKTLKRSTGQYHIIQPMITKLEDTAGLTFPQNTKAYISNLEALGLLNVRRDVWLNDEQVYTELGQRHEVHVNEGSEYQPGTEKGVIEITNLGTMFIDSCVVLQA